MAGQASPAAAEADAPKKTPDEIASEKAAAEAKAKLQLFRVTTDRKLGSPSPHQAFELVPGANHFGGPLPEPVAVRFAALQKAGTITVETLDGDGKATPWKPEEKK
jgi:hypothetical protein